VGAKVHVHLEVLRKVAEWRPRWDRDVLIDLETGDYAHDG